MLLSVKHEHDKNPTVTRKSLFSVKSAIYYCLLWQILMKSLELKSDFEKQSPSGLKSEIKAKRGFE